MEKIITREEICAIIPHRPPFLMVDELLELIPGKSAIGRKYIYAEEYYFQGHFPGNPVMPGVLMVEGLAQTGSTILLCMPEYKGKVPMFAGMDDVRFRKIVRPGDVITYEARITKQKGAFGKMQGTVKVGDQIVVSGEFTFALG